MKSPYKHVKAYSVKGNTYRYYCPPGTKGIRLVGEPGTVEFSQSYEKASKPFIEACSGFNSLLSRYIASSAFTNLADRTKSDYLKFKVYVNEKWGGEPLALFEDKRIRGFLIAWHEELITKVGTRQADLIIAFMRVVLSYGVYCSELSNNHLMGFRGAYKADRSDAIWTPEDVQAFMDSAPRHLRLAMMLALHLGRREGDLIKLTWGDYSGTHISVSNRKGGRRARFQAGCTQALRATLDAYKLSLVDRRGNSRLPAPEEPILTTPTGAKWVESHFSTKFSKAKNAAGLRHLHFHDLRGTAITVLAENGCTNAEIAAISGHSQKHIAKILDMYMSQTRALNESAMKKMEQSWIASVSAIE